MESEPKNGSTLADRCFSFLLHFNLKGGASIKISSCLPVFFFQVSLTIICIKLYRRWKTCLWDVLIWAYISIVSTSVSRGLSAGPHPFLLLREVCMIQRLSILRHYFASDAEFNRWHYFTNCVCYLDPHTTQECHYALFLMKFSFCAMFFAVVGIFPPVAIAKWEKV